MRIEATTQYIVPCSYLVVSVQGGTVHGAGASQAFSGLSVVGSPSGSPSRHSRRESLFWRTGVMPKTFSACTPASELEEKTTMPT